MKCDLCILRLDTIICLLLYQDSFTLIFHTYGTSFAGIFQYWLYLYISVPTVRLLCIYPDCARCTCSVWHYVMLFKNTTIYATQPVFLVDFTLLSLYFKHLFKTITVYLIYIDVEIIRIKESSCRIDFPVSLKKDNSICPVHKVAVLQSGIK